MMKAEPWPEPKEQTLRHVTLYSYRLLDFLENDQMSGHNRNKTKGSNTCRLKSSVLA